jgi:hypothetical protein
LNNYRFCNINREHDAVTVFIDERFRKPFAHFGINFMIKQMTYCRIFNEPETLKQVCPIIDLDNAKEKLQKHRAAGNKLFRGAYMMPVHSKKKLGVEVLGYWLKVVGDVASVDYEQESTLAGIAAKLQLANGIGPFLANQICTDLRYVRTDVSKEWDYAFKDRETFVLCGPGTRRGINRFRDRLLLAPGSDETFAESLLAIRQEVLPECSSEIQKHFTDPNNLANSFCEFDK